MPSLVGSEMCIRDRLRKNKDVDQEDWRLIISINNKSFDDTL